MVVNLTQGAIARIFSDDSVYCSDVEINPVLQIIEVENRCVWLSDGTNSDVGLLAGNLFNLFFLEKLQKGSVVRLTIYTRSKSSNRVIFIFDCDVVLDKCDIIGKPAPLPKYANGADLLLKYDAASQPQPDINGWFMKINCLGLNDLGFSDLGLSNLSLYDNTKHSALEMMCSDDFSLANNDLKPVLVLQVVLSFHNYICLSDGKNVVSALVPRNLVDESRCYEVDILSSGFKDELVHSTLPQVGTIVKLTNYTLKEFQRHKFIIIIRFDVVLENHVIIGRPVQLPTNPSWTYHPIQRFYLTCPPVKLTQGAIDNILSGNFSSDKGFKPVLQVFCLRNSIIFLSDGCYRFYLICDDGDLRGRFKNRSRFSVIKLTDYYVLENSKNHKVVVVRDLEVILNNMWKIGKPALLPEEAPYLGVSRPAMNVQ